MRYIFIFLFTAVAFLNSSFVFAEDYEKTIEDLQEQIDDLKKRVEENEKKDRLAKTNSFNASNLLNGLKLDARIHIVGSWFDENKQLKSYNLNDYNNHFSIRRARLRLIKEINNFVFSFEGNFDKDRAYLGETFIGYNFYDDEMVVRFGQVITPAFMEREKSTNTASTIEFNAFTRDGWLPSYLMGLSYFWRADKFGMFTGFFGNGTNLEGRMEKDMKYNFSYRGFYTPIRNDNYVVHLGADFVYQDYNSNTADINETYTYGFELGFQYKYITWVNEYIRKYYKYNNRFDGKTFGFDGLSTELTITFTGEHKKYQRTGYFSGIQVKNPLSKGGAGAFQGALRYSIANGKDTKAGFVNNIGSRYDYTVGLTWIPEDYLRLLFNYSLNGITGANYTSKGKYNAFQVELRMYF